MELIDLDSGEYNLIDTKTFFGFYIYTYEFSLLSIENKKLYFAIFLEYNHFNCKIIQLSFPKFNLTIANKEEKKTIPTNLNHRTVNAFMFDEQLAILYLNNEYNYFMNINNLDFTNSNLDINITKGGIWETNGLFFKGIHIKDNLFGFMYYLEFNNKGLKMRIGSIEPNNTFQTIFFKEFNNYSFYIEECLNDFIKINDERLASCSVNVDQPKYFQIFIFDLYNNYQSIKIRVYSLYISDYKINKELSLALYNNYLVFSSTVTDENEYNQVDDNSKRFSILILFGYVNGTDSSINIIEYLKDDYINSNNNIVNFLTNYTIIDNNIFG